MKEINHKDVLTIFLYKRNIPYGPFGLIRNNKKPIETEYTHLIQQKNEFKLKFKMMVHVPCMCAYQFMVIEGILLNHHG